MKLMDRLARAEASVKPKIGGPIEVAIILGTGLGGIADTVEHPTIIPYSEIDSFPRSTVPGHAGRLVVGSVAGRSVAMMQGRFHYYEGWAADDIKLPVYLFKQLGARTLIVTNAAGGLNPAFRPGDIMLIADHINLTGRNPLIGENDESIGARFPDTSNAYDRDRIEVARRTAKMSNQQIREGVYIAVTGPTYETNAERRYLRKVGGDAIGMSTVPEVIAAKHCGLKVVGFSIITNVATGEPGQEPDSHETVMRAANAAGGKLADLIAKLIPLV